MANLIVDDEIDLTLYERETDAKQCVKPAAVYVQELIDRISNPVLEKRALMPWAKTHGQIAFRPGEVTVWGGPNGSGKSLILGQVALSLCAQGYRTCIASFEMKPVKSLERMGRQWTKTNPSDPLVLSDSHERDIMLDLFGQFRDWTDKQMWIYDRQGTVDWIRVCAVARYCAKELGISHFIIDNLMKCVQGEDDYNGQKGFVDALTAIARDHAIHVHLVHHIKKPATEDSLPGKYDFKGTGAITDQVDNAIVVWRNKRKERDRQAGKPVSISEPDAKLLVDKQRNGEGWEGVIGLWYHAHTQQFLAGESHKPMTFYGA